MTLATAFYVVHVNPVVKGGVQEVAHGEISESSELTKPVKQNELNFAVGGTASEYIWIPMPENTTASDVAIENHYMDHQLWVAINSAENAEDFYSETQITGNLSDISGGSYEVEEGRIVLKLNMEHIYEYSTIFENGVLYIEKKLPAEVYDRLIIIDPAGQAPDELLLSESATPEQICLDISAKLRTLLEKEDIRVYVTGMDNRTVADDDRLFLLTEIKPDMYIRIETGSDSDSKVYGTETVYNGTYFIPGFGSVELADLLEAEVTTNIGGKVGGLILASEDDYVITNATVPAATIKVGYYTNMQENILLNRDDYREKIAQGIANAVMKAYEE